MEKAALYAVAAVLAFSPGPVFAEASASVPEGSSITLLALGLLGIIIGRRGAMRPKDTRIDSDRK